MDAAPFTLAIETSNPSSGGAGVAIGRETAGGLEVLGDEPLRPSGPHDDDLMSAISRLAQRIGIAPRHIGRIAVSIGPGGYTALRIGIAGAKMIAYSNRAGAIGIPTAEVVAQRIPGPRRGCLIALASKTETAFVTRFSASGTPAGPGAVLDAGGLASWIREDPPGLLVGDQFLPKGFYRVAEGHGIDTKPPAFDPIACLEASVGRPNADPAAILPLYARPPEAVTLWQNRNA